MQRAGIASDTEGWVTVKRAAAVSGYNPEYIRQLARAGTVAARKEGVAYLVNQKSLAQYQASRERLTTHISPSTKGATATSSSTPWRTLHGADPRLTSDPYLTDAAVRKERNAAVIAHLDALSVPSASPAEVKEQRETYRFVRKSLDTDRLSTRKRFRTRSLTGSSKNKGDMR